ncbi:MAG: hypothetical protein ACYDD1_07955 [Caulobacteraceae bacterium]
MPETSSCDHCGAAFPAAELRPLSRIEEVVIDLATGLPSQRPVGRGRTPWMPQRGRDPSVLVRTPRYEYVRSSYAVCPDCLQRAEVEEQGLNRFHRRGTLVVALTAGALGLVLLSVWAVWPGLYASVGLIRSNPAQPFADAPPPSTKPYKPPFSAATPVAP